MYQTSINEFALLDNKQYMFTSHHLYNKTVIVIFKLNDSQNHLVDNLAFACDTLECYVPVHFFANPMFNLYFNEHAKQQRALDFPGMDDTIRMYVFVQGRPFAPVKYTNTVVADVNKWLPK